MALCTISIARYTRIRIEETCNMGWYTRQGSWSSWLWVLDRISAPLQMWTTKDDKYSHGYVRT